MNQKPERQPDATVPRKKNEKKEQSDCERNNIYVRPTITIKTKNGRKKNVKEVTIILSHGKMSIMDKSLIDTKTGVNLKIK